MVAYVLNKMASKSRFLMWNMKSIHKTINVDWSKSNDSHSKEAVLMLKIRYASTPNEVAKRHGKDDCVGYVTLEAHWFDGYSMYNETMITCTSGVEFEEYCISRDEDGKKAVSKTESYEDLQGDLYVLKLFNKYDCLKKPFESVPDIKAIPVSYLTDYLKTTAD